MFSRQSKKPAPSKLERRASSLSEPELLAWIDNSLGETWKAVDTYRKQVDTVYLAQATTSADELVVLLAHLRQRHQH